MRYILITAILLLSACDPSIQTSSGQAFLAARPDVPIDADIKAAAIGEPALRFPAKIAVAFQPTDRRTFATIPAVLTKSLLPAAQKAGMGEIVALNPLIYNSASAHVDKKGVYWRNEIKRLRATAAKQHADYLLIIDADKRGRNGHITAAFFDTRTGYAYASADAMAYVGWASADRAGNRLAREIAPQLEAMMEGLAERATKSLVDANEPTH